MNELNPKQERFCEEYVIDMNGTQAAIRAGYSEKTARTIANQLLTKLDIQARVKELQAEIAERNKITADKVIAELAKLAFMTIDELYDENGNIKEVKELSDKAQASISSVKVTEKTYGKDENETTEITKEIKLWDKGKALVELGKHFGIFEKDNDQIKPNNFQIIVNRE